MKTLIEEIVIFDRRNSSKLEVIKQRIQLVQKSSRFMTFLANWRFPVPATKRRYFMGKREFVVEECGKVPRRNIFRFAGTFLR